MQALNSEPHTLSPMRLPDYVAFAEACRLGLSTVYPFKQGVTTDPYGWKFGKGWPPSYEAFGRMRTLLTTQDAMLLNPRRALEIAAGGGGLSARLAAKGCSVVVNDLREEELKNSLKEFSGGESVRIEGGNMFDLSPGHLGKFDLVLACEIIEHVAHPDKLLNHLKEFLEPGGHLLLTTPNGSYFRNKLPTYSEVRNFDQLEARQFEPDADGHLFLLTPDELRQLASSAGLSIDRLSVWGTPMMTGHVAFRHLAGPSLLKPAYLTERLAQRLPPGERVRACVALSACLRLR